MCRFFDDTLDRECTYCFTFMKINGSVYQEKNRTVIPCIITIITLVSSSLYMLEILRDSITLKIIVKKAFKLKLLKEFVDERKC